MFISFQPSFLLGISPHTCIYIRVRVDNAHMRQYECTVQLQTQLQAAIDNAERMMASSVHGDRVDTAACTEAAKRLEITLNSMGAAATGDGSPVVVSAKQLVSFLKVCVYACFCIPPPVCMQA